MTNQMLFIDGSVNPQTKVGYGSYLILNELDTEIEAYKARIITHQFDNTTSTRLELQILLYALEKELPGNELLVYTDSQNIIELPKRRSMLESREFKSKSGRVLNNQDLYIDFYRLIDEFDFRLVKVRGHTKSVKRSSDEQIFAMVDQASRSALRNSANTE